MHGGQNERETQEDWTSHIFHHLLPFLSSSCPSSLTLVFHFHEVESKDRPGFLPSR